MNKTITVKGIGRAAAKPDLVVLKMDLSTRKMKYEETMDFAAMRIESLTKTLEKVGFKKQDLKTINFDIDTVYESEKDQYGNYHHIFKGYKIRQSLKLEFDFDMKRLAETLTAVGECDSKPELSIRFSIKDISALNKEMLRSASVNARRKAEILCQASGAKLGNLISIDYNWGEVDIYSHTNYEMAEKCLTMSARRTIDIEPEDIDINDTVTFVWEIE